MSLLVNVVGGAAEIPPGAVVARVAADLIQLEKWLIDAQVSTDPKELWLIGEGLLKAVVQAPGGKLRVQFPRDPLPSLIESYGPMPALIGIEVAQRWLMPPHPRGIPLERLLLARVLRLPELEEAGAPSPLLRSLEAASDEEASAAFAEQAVQRAWMVCGPPLAVGTPSAPGPVADPCDASAAIVARLLIGYADAARSALGRTTHWHAVERLTKATELLQSIDLPDPRVLGLERLASLAALLTPGLTNVPLDQYLGVVSGRLRPELDVLLDRLQRESPPESLALEEIRRKFNWLLEVDNAALARYQAYADAAAVAALVRTKLPLWRGETTPGAQEELGQWIRFFDDVYVPALKAWRRSGGRREGPDWQALYGADMGFARWIAAAFPKLKGQPIPPLAYGEVRRRSRLATEEAPSIVLLIDCLSWEMVNMLRQEAMAAGMWVSDVIPALASLPTITDVGMLTAVAGLPVTNAWADDHWETEEARRRREMLLRDRVPGAVVRVISQIAQITDALTQPSRLYVLVWSDIDSAAHRYADHQLFLEHTRVSLRRVLSALVQAVDSTPHLQARKERVQLIVSTDHGWTDLLDIEPVLRPRLNGLRAHHRLFQIDRPLTSEEVEELGPDWIAIGGPDFDLPAGRTYLVPSRNAPIERGTFRQHGGLSLTEVLVPMAVVGLAQSTYRGLAMVLCAGSAPLVKEHPGEVTIWVSNPNHKDLRDLRVTCAELDLRAESARIDANKTVNIGQFPVRPKISGEVRAVEIQAWYEGGVVGPRTVELERPLAVERTANERMAGDYSGLEDLLG